VPRTPSTSSEDGRLQHLRAGAGDESPDPISHSSPARMDEQGPAGGQRRPEVRESLRHPQPTPGGGRRIEGAMVQVSHSGLPIIRTRKVQLAAEGGSAGM